MEELFSHIGKLYVDVLSMQKYIELLQSQLKEKEKKISELQSKSDINE